MYSSLLPLRPPFGHLFHDVRCIGSASKQMFIIRADDGYDSTVGMST